MNKDIIKRNYPKRNKLEEDIFKDDFEVLVGNWNLPRHTWEKRTLPAVKSINSIIGKAPIKIVAKDKEGHKEDPETGLIVTESKKWCFDPETKLFLIDEKRYEQYRFQLSHQEPMYVCERRVKTFEYWKTHEDWGGFFIYGLNELPLKSTSLYLKLAYPEIFKDYVLLRERVKHPRARGKGNGLVVVNANYCLKEDLQRAYDELKAGNMNVVKFFKDNLWTYYTESDEDVQRMLEDLDASINGKELESVMLEHTWAGNAKEEEQFFKYVQSREEDNHTKIVMSEGLQAMIDLQKENLTTASKEEVQARIDKLMDMGYAHPLQEQLEEGYEKANWGNKTEAMQKYYKEQKEKALKEKEIEENNIKLLEEKRILEEKLKIIQSHFENRDQLPETEMPNTEDFSLDEFDTFAPKEAEPIKNKTPQAWDYIENNIFVNIDENTTKRTSLKIDEDMRNQFLKIMEEDSMAKALLKKIKKEESYVPPEKKKPLPYFMEYYLENRNKEIEKKMDIQLPVQLLEELNKKYGGSANTILNAYIYRTVLEYRGEA